MEPEKLTAPSPPYLVNGIFFRRFARGVTGGDTWLGKK